MTYSVSYPRVDSAEEKKIWFMEIKKKRNQFSVVFFFFFFFRHMLERIRFQFFFLLRLITYSHFSLI